jgi:Fur family ferric uptake transcriptional regulator
VERSTAQRRAIREALEKAARPLSPAEVLRGARPIARLGIATVYRTLKSMLEDGSIVAVQLPGEAARYELAGKDHHHHFVCRICKRAFEIEGCAHALAAAVPRGFRVERHEVVLYGRCAECSKRRPT